MKSVRCEMEDKENNPRLPSPVSRLPSHTLSDSAISIYKTLACMVLQHQR